MQVSKFNKKHLKKAEDAQSKCRTYNNKDDDNSLNPLNNKTDHI